MQSAIKTYYRKHPLRLILFVGLALRLIAAIYSKGYAMTDDHFKIINEAANEVHQKPSTFWTPNYRDDKESKRSMLYPYANYLLFEALYALDISDPQTMMFINRLLHALFSMLIIVFTFKITRLHASEKMALLAAWIAAIFWFLPMMSVRNLIEVVCIPFLMGGTYLVLKAYQQKLAKKYFFWAGVLLSFAFTIRYQTVAFSAGLGIYLLFQKQWKATALLLVGGLLPLIPNHYILETTIYGFEPFEKIINYINFNLSNAKSYVTGPWYNFIVLFLGIFIPPFSIILGRGLLRTWKNHLILLLPFALFIVFHSVFPGKQERFILPVLMFFPMLGLIGYNELKTKRNWFQKHPNFFKISWKIFLVINIILLIPITLTYSKRSRVESMYYLVDKAQEDKNVLIFMAGRINDINLMPVFYSDYASYPSYYKIGSETALKESMEKFSQLDKDRLPDYLFVVQHEEMESRLKELEKQFTIEYKKTVDASFIDKLMHWLNPRNKNYDMLIYKLSPKESKQ